MKKNIIYIIIVLLSIIVVAGVSYIIIDSRSENKEGKTNKEENKTIENNKESSNEVIKLTSISEESNKIIEEFRIKLNGKSKTINVEFTKENYEDMDAYIIGGHLGDKPVLFTDFILNEEGNIFTKEKINELFNENNFRIIKGADNKDYLLVVSNFVNDDKLYIFNDNLALLNNESVDDYNPYCDNDCGGFMITTYSNTPCVFENNENPWYENYFNITKSILDEDDINYSLKIENNKIYYLAAVIEDYTNAKLEERVYTINNNQLTYEVINTYNATQVCQAT